MRMIQFFGAGRRFFAVLALCTALVACKKDPIPEIEPEPEPEPAEVIPKLEYPAPQNTGLKIAGYFPYYQDVAQVPDSILKKIDVACYAFAVINESFTLDVQQSSRLMNLVARCHALGKKVVLSFNGSHSLYKQMVSKTANRQKFVKWLIMLMDSYHLDGVDNDWEYPREADGTGLFNTYLMRELSNYCHAPGNNKLLTMAITCGKYVGSISRGIQAECFPCCDWFNVMCYDDFSTSVAGIHHSPFSLMEVAYAYWVETRGMPAYQFMGGIPVYGRPSGISQSGTILTFSNILKQGGDPDANSASVTASGYQDGKTPYTVYYNGRPLVKQKTQFLVDNKTAGAMFWEVGQDVYDDRSLIGTAYNVLFL